MSSGDPVPALQKRVNALFATSAPPAAPAKRSLFQAVAAPPQAPPTTGFSPFRREDALRVHGLADEFHKIASADGDPTAKVVARAEHEMTRNDPRLVQQALSVFAATTPGFQAKIPTLRDTLRARGGVPASAVLGPTPEPQMDYWRHDIDLSDHHQHWHTIYPPFDRESPVHGQLFLYMHQQMLARYDTDRRAVGLNPVDPYATTFAEYGDPARAVPATPVPAWIAVVFPDTFFARGGGFLPGRVFAGTQRLANQQQSFARLKPTNYPNAEALGRDIESSRYYASDPVPSNIHNQGHMLLGYVDATPPPRLTVMADTPTAITDPVFYRWHRRIDDVSFAWQEAQTPNVLNAVQLADGTTSVTLGLDNNAAVTLHGATTVPWAKLGGAGFADFGTKTFGGPAWGTDLGDAAFAHVGCGRLGTELVRDADTREERLRMADHFVTYVRVENTDLEHNLKVVFRVFLMSDEFYGAGDRRHAIELDKFAATLAPGTKTVVARPSWYSTVVRRKSVGDDHLLPGSLDDEAAPASDDVDLNNWCDCGLPYRLLLPRGTPAGQQFKLVVVMTDGEDDLIEHDDVECGSVSYCGRRAALSRSYAYNDARAMGYPFDRRLAGEERPTPQPAPLHVLLERAANVAISPLTITNTVKL